MLCKEREKERERERDNERESERESGEREERAVCDMRSIYIAMRFPISLSK